MIAALALGCSGEEGSTPQDPGSEANAPRASRPAARPADVPLDTVDVDGAVATDVGEPLAARAVTLVDARGARQEATTNADGAFAFSGVTLPYDIAVSAAPWAVFVGLTRRDPHLELFERSGPTPSAPHQTLRVGVRASQCPASACFLTVASTSTSGSGSVTIEFPKNEGVVVVDVDHGWRGALAGPKETIDVRVLVGDQARSSFSYAALVPITATPGELVDLGIISVAPVPSSAPRAFGVQSGGGGLVDWEWQTAVYLELGREPSDVPAGFLFAMAESQSLETRVPLIPRSTVRVDIGARHPRADMQAGFFRSTEVWSGARSITSDVTLAVVHGPEIVRPAASGTLSRRGLGFAWSNVETNGLSTLTVVDVARARARFRVVTVGHELTLAKLSTLGLPRLDSGDHFVDVRGAPAPAGGMDDVVSPDPVLRHRPFDRAQAGTATQVRIPFQVTP
jgi:hypothetical protein